MVPLLSHVNRISIFSDATWGECTAPSTAITHFVPTLGCTQDTAVQAEHTSRRIGSNSLVMTFDQAALYLSASCTAPAGTWYD